MTSLITLALITQLGSHSFKEREFAHLFLVSLIEFDTSRQLVIREFYDQKKEKYIGITDPEIQSRCKRIFASYCTLPEDMPNLDRWEVENDPYFKELVEKAKDFAYDWYSSQAYLKEASYIYAERQLLNGTSKEILNKAIDKAKANQPNNTDGILP